MNFCDESIDIRSIQQFLYCKRRWGLITNDCAWAENAFVVKGNLIHENVDKGKHTSNKSGIVLRNIRVYNDEWNIYGVIDCLELKYNSNGIKLPDYDGSFMPCIVEYKPSAPKIGDYRYEDAMQLLAQKICLDTILKTDCGTAFYYDNIRRRVTVKFNEDDYSFLKSTVKKMQQFKQEGVIPPKSANQYCSGCSMKDICIPKGVEICENS